MKKLMVLFFIFTLAVFGTSSAMAEEATVIKDFGCQIIPADSGLPVVLTTTDKTQAVESASGMSILHAALPSTPRLIQLKKR